MLTFLQHHVLLLQTLTAVLALTLAALVLWVALRPEQDDYDAAHRGRRRAWRVHPHEPRHAAPTYHPHHAAAEAGPSAFLGRGPDGDLILVDDEHTHELIGAAA